MSLSALLFWCLILFDGDGRLDKYWAHGLVRDYVRSEGVRLGYFFPWDWEEGMDPVHEVRKAYRELRLKPYVAPDEPGWFIVEQGTEACPTSFYRMLNFNLRCQQTFLKRLDGMVVADEWLLDMLEELQRRHRIYDLLDDLNRTKYKLWEKRLKCHDLKLLLSAEDYWGGRYPAIVPVERFPIREESPHRRNSR